MADLIVSATVSRTELSLSALDLNVDGAYKIVRDGLGIGSLTFKKEMVSSIYVNGSFMRGRAMESITSTMKIRCYGSSKADLESKVRALVDAFSQYSYTLQVIIDGRTQTYRCDTADSIAIGDSGTFDPLMWYNTQQEVTITFTRDPVTTGQML